MPAPVNEAYFGKSRLRAEMEGFQFSDDGSSVITADPNPDPARRNPAGIFARNGGMVAARRVTLYQSDLMMRFASPGRLPAGHGAPDLLNSPWWIEQDRMVLLITRAREAAVPLVEMARRQLALPETFTDANRILAVRPRAGLVLGAWAGRGLTAEGAGERRIIPGGEAPHLHMEQLYIPGLGRMGGGLPKGGATPRRGSTPRRSRPMTRMRQAFGRTRCAEGETHPVMELKLPPSMTRFCPTMKPACAPQRKAQAWPNSSGSPTRPAGLLRACSAR